MPAKNSESPGYSHFSPFDYKFEVSSNTLMFNHLLELFTKLKTAFYVWLSVYLNDTIQEEPNEVTYKEIYVNKSCVQDMYSVGRKYRGIEGEGSEIPHSLQKQNPDSQCLYVKNPKFLSPTVPDFSFRFPFRDMMGQWPLDTQRLCKWGRWGWSIERASPFSPATGMFPPMTTPTINPRKGH